MDPDLNAPDLDDPNPPGGFDPEHTPSAADFEKARLQVGYARAAELLTNALVRAQARLSEPDLTEADLCDQYLLAHQPTVYAEGRFWRCPQPDRPWIQVPDDHIATELLAVLQRHQSQGPAPTRHRLRSVLDLLRLRLDTVAPGHWDNPVNAIPLADHLLEFGAREPVAYEPDLHIATALPHHNVYDAECPSWTSFLEAAVPAAAGFLQEFAGYCLTTDLHHELCLWLCGPASGARSFFLQGLQLLLDQRAGFLRLADLARGRLDPQAVRGKTLLMAAEPCLPAACVSPLVALVTGQPLTLTRPHGPPYTLHTHAKLVLSIDGLPAVDLRFAGLYHRAAFVVFPGESPDPQLRRRLKDETEGLFRWALKGLNRYRRRGRLEPPAFLSTFTERLRLAAVSPAGFLAERCLLAPGVRTSGSGLHQAYADWCRRQGARPLVPRLAAGHWKALGLQHHTINGRAWWFGAQLLPGLVTDVEPAPVELAESNAD